MKRLFAVPVRDGQACAHFGHCDGFALVDVDNDRVVSTVELAAPAHARGAYPHFLATAGVQVVLAGGMGGMARELFRQEGIEVQTGIGSGEPGSLVAQFLRHELPTRENQCDHGDDLDHEHHCRD